jgi:hypothetical protein
MKLAIAGLMFGAFLLTGCAASVQKSSTNAALKTNQNSAKQITLNVTGSKQITDSGDWEQLKGEWRAAMKSAAASIGAKYSSQEGKPQSTGEPGTLVVVNVNDYRYLSPGARYGFGIMTGNAYVDSTVQFLDLKTGAQLGEREYNTSSSAWQGIFSAMTEKQIQAISLEIANEIKAK